MKRFCKPHDENTDDGAALYVTVVLMIFAVGIVVLIGMMAFKRKRYEEWDKQGKDALKHLDISLKPSLYMDVHVFSYIFI